MFRMSKAKTIAQTEQVRLRCGRRNGNETDWAADRLAECWPAVLSAPQTDHAQLPANQITEKVYTTEQVQRLLRRERQTGYNYIAARFRCCPVTTVAFSNQGLAESWRKERKSWLETTPLGNDDRFESH